VEAKLIGKTASKSTVDERIEGGAWMIKIHDTLPKSFGAAA
jgi:hypothetical protein